MKNKALKLLIKKHKETKGNSYLEIIGIDDMKKQKHIRSHFFNLSEVNLDEIQTKINDFNINTYGVYINLNPLKSNKRNNKESCDNKGI